jgi:hypothetical protein
VVITGGNISGIVDLAVVDGGTGASSASAARNNLGAAASGAITGSGLTQAADRILGRTTAGTGAIEEISIGSGLSLSAGTLSSTAAGGTVTSVAVSGGTTGLTVSGSPITTSGTITLNGTLAVANGGTGATSLTANNVILGNGTSAVQVVAPGTNGNVLTSNGTTWVSQAASGGSLLGVTDSATPFETALGHQAGNANTGIQNTYIGYRAGLVNSTGTQNTVVGYLALSSNTGGSDNTAIGSNSLAANTASNNIAVGARALRLNTSSGRNIAIGVEALESNTTGSGSNIAIGQVALKSNTTGNSNVAVGDSALTLNTTGTNNTAVGFQTLDANTTGQQNVAMGHNALGANTTASNNTGIGFEALVLNTTGNNNTTVGYHAGDKVSTGIQNSLFGSQAGSSGTNDLTTGSNNTIIGFNAASSTATVSNEITLGNSSVTNFRVPGVGFQFDTTDGLIVPKTITAAGTTGARTIDKTAGTVNFAAAATSLVVTNSFVDANSVIIATVGTNDSTMKSVAVVAGTGSFTLHANAAATAETRVNWFVIN